MKNFTKTFFLFLLIMGFTHTMYGQTITNQYYNVTQGNGYGIRFWSGNGDYYKIHMGNSSYYKYGPVQDYSIKMTMNNDSDRGWTWGVKSTAPIAALNTQGTFQLAKDLKVMGKISIGTEEQINTFTLGDGTANPAIRIQNNSNSNTADIYSNYAGNTGDDRNKKCFGYGVYPAKEAWIIYHNETGNVGDWKTLLQIDKYGILQSEGIEVKDLYTNYINTKEIKAKEINVEINNVADYVFSDDYDLKPLSEVETFVNKHKHLPDVPSGKDLEKTGMNVSEMSNLLLQKVEELTLHMIALEKQNKNLVLEVEELKSQIK